MESLDNSLVIEAVKAEGGEHSKIENEIKKTINVSKKKEKISGIIYLSCIPQLMNVAILRKVLGKFGEIGNIFLQPDTKATFSKKGRLFTEGWVEFADKKVAKQVAAILNNTQVGGKRKNPWYVDIWNIKYLPKFQWAHLNERLAYERAVHEQRLRNEISQVKRETNFHVQNFEKSRKLKDIEERKRKRGEALPEIKSYNIRLRETEDEILATKKKREDTFRGKKKRERMKKSSHRPDGEHGVGALSLAANKSLMQKLFGGSGGIS